MNLHSKITRGMRLNNPSNAFESYLPDQKTRLVEGIAAFDNLELGCRSLFYRINSLYKVQGIVTLDKIIPWICRPSDTDLAQYIKQASLLIGANPLYVTTRDLYLFEPWSALTFARAIIRIENGAYCGPEETYREWVPPMTLIQAMANTEKWKVA